MSSQCEKARGGRWGEVVNVGNEGGGDGKRVMRLTGALRGVK